MRRLGLGHRVSGKSGPAAASAGQEGRPVTTRNTIALNFESSSPTLPRPEPTIPQFRRGNHRWAWGPSLKFAMSRRGALRAPVFLRPMRHCRRGPRMDGPRARATRPYKTDDRRLLRWAWGSSLGWMNRKDAKAQRERKSLASCLCVFALNLSVGPLGMGSIVHSLIPAATFGRQFVISP